jgi:DNA repair protein RecO (recombination protein O)
MNMPKIYHAQALVLSKKDFGEADSLVSCYTPYLGKLEVLAKGARRPQSHLGGHVESISLVKMSLVRGRNLDMVTQSQTIEGFISLHNDLIFLSSALYLADLVNQFTPEGEPNYAIFKLLSNTWQKLASIASKATNHQVESGKGGVLNLNTHRLMLLRRFEIFLLKYLGYQPQLEHCLDCGVPILSSQPNSSRRVFFSPQSGGVICYQCSLSQVSSAYPISFAVLRFWRWLSESSADAIIRTSWKEASKAKGNSLHIASKSQERLLKLTSELGQILQRYFTYLLGYKLYSADWLERIQEVQ